MKIEEEFYELHYNYYHYADPLSMQGYHKGIEKFLSLDAAKSARDNILDALKYYKCKDYEECKKIMTEEQYQNLMNQFGDFNGHFTEVVEIYKVKQNIEKEKIN